MGATGERAVETLYGLGHWLLEQTRAADAEHVFKTMLMTAPHDERSWLGLGMCHEQKGEIEVAKGLYTLAEATVPQSYRCPLARARLLRREDSDLAQQLYETAEERALAADEQDVAAAIASERSSL